ncbi:hypothetical protein BC940DRAFT_354249 [Gongronella butleri]|nr:hypothetical protein BC940DRAFT_354249 [Gongronella butleri]
MLQTAQFDAISFISFIFFLSQLDYPEDLAFVLYTQPVRGLMMKPSMSTPGKMKDYVAQQAARLPRMKRSVSRSVDSRTRIMAGYKKVMTAPLASFSSSSSSSLRSSLRDDASVVQSGQRLYQLEAPQHQQQPFEILVDFQWQWAPVTEVTTVRPHRLDRHAPNDVSTTAAAATSATPSYPWLKYNMDAVSPLSPDLENPEILFANKDAIQSALHHADNGDFLTFYVHGIAYPEWKRYWVTLEHHRLLLRPFAYKNKEPVHAIPLQQLVQVSKPTEEDQEYICLNRQLGAVLQFELPAMPSRLRESVWSGPGGSKVYMLADHADAALNWRRALTFHVLTLAQQQQDFPATLHDQENIYNIDYSRFLW